MRKLFSMVCCLLATCILSAQDRDSIRLTLAEAEQIFLEKNLQLLAQTYQVDVAKANELQQKLFDNPVFSAELATYGDNHKWFDIGGRGQKVFSIDQLITLAGKRNKRVALAREVSAGSTFQLQELLRTLKYELRQQFYTADYAADVLVKYDEQIEWLQRVIRSYDAQVVKRNVSLKDAVRLKSELIQLNADRNGIMNELITARQNLSILLDTAAAVIPIHEELQVLVTAPLPDLLELARNNRADLQLSQSMEKQEELNFNLQKAMAKPDLTLGAAYDQQGSYISNYYSLRAAIDLPLFNRNQGNIRAARTSVKAAAATTGYKLNEVAREVQGSYERWKEAEREYAVSNLTFNTDFPEVNRAVMENFNKGNLNLLEFMDFFENYNMAIRQINQLHKQRRIAWADLEFTVGTRIGN
ncbi:MAG: TolC family protein [Chitinophagaceae bacterium]|nr:MAG: TolC family protein [Chitinophagaceae bacterium]